MFMRSLPVYLLLLYLKMHRSDGADTTYTTKYDGVNLDEVLASERLLNGYISCLLDKGPCTPDGKELKTNLPDAIINDCGKCTKRQQQGADQVMHYIIDHRPDDWLKLEDKYNSDGSYKNKYLEHKDNSAEKEAPADKIKETSDNPKETTE